MMTFKGAVKTASLFVAVLLAVLGMTATPVGAQIVNPANGHLYQLLPPGLWADQKAAAEALGGFLVTINDAAENDWIVANFAVGSEPNYIYIGFTDEVTEGEFVWLNGEPVTYTNWQDGEPNDFGGAEDVTLIFPDGFDTFAWPAGVWADASGLAGDFFEDGLNPALVEIELGPTPTITRDQVIDWAFTNGSGSWSVEFSEDVEFVVDADFSLDLSLGNAVASGPTVTGAGASYTASISGVSGTGTIILNFDPIDVVAVVGGEAAEPASGVSQWFSNVVPAPAAMGWVLVFLAVVLALAAAVMLRRKGLKH